jgi:hypothetical protein
MPQKKKSAGRANKPAKKAMKTAKKAAKKSAPKAKKTAKKSSPKPSFARRPGPGTASRDAEAEEE